MGGTTVPEAAAVSDRPRSGFVSTRVAAKTDGRSTVTGIIVHVGGASVRFHREPKRALHSTIVDACTFP